VEGTTNYFAATEYDALTNEGTFSSEVNYVVPVPIPPNHPPTLNGVLNLTVNQNSPAQTVALSGISTGATNEIQTLKVTAISSKTSLIPNPTVTYKSPSSTGTLTFKPPVNATGTATITVTVNDGGASNNIVTRSFLVTVVNPVALAAMPKITRQLTNASTMAGKTISMAVTVAGKSPFKYQWKFNGTNLPGATTSKLTLKGVKANQAGAYSVLISNPAGFTNSVAAQLTVITNPAPTIASPIQSNGVFSFQVSGVPGSKYVVQASSDLSKWVSVSTNTAPFSFTETNSADFNKRFYRSYYLP
jgi:hypothetical protein